MDKLVIQPVNLIDHTNLPQITVDHALSDGDPVEIDGEMFYVCEQNSKLSTDSSTVGVIPLVVRNPANVLNIKDYIQCLSLAHRKVIFRNDKGNCELENCNEMIIK